MIKLIYPEANEQLLSQCEGIMTKVFFNNSSNQFLKEASSNSITKELLDECKPDKDHFAIHFIGVGDYEKYGFNKNADAFPKLANQKYYDTFEKKAHLFREHKSDHPEQNAIGVIKKAAYNPEMGRIEIVAHCNIKKAAEEYEKAKAGDYLSCSMGCFPKGTLINTSEDELKPIEELSKGDFVLSGSKAIKKLEDIYKYNFTGNLVKINVTGLAKTIVCTDNHPIFTRHYYRKALQDAPAICPVCGKHVNYLKTHIVRSSDDNHQNFLKEYTESFNSSDNKFVDANELSIGDYIISPVKKITAASHTIEQLKFARFLGYFAAEGNYVKYRGNNEELKKNPFRAIQLNFNINELDFINEVVDLLKFLCPDGKPTVQQRGKKHITCISMYDRAFAQKVYNACGEYSYAKVLNTSLINSWDKDCIFAFLDAFINGDGTYSKVRNSLSFTTVSYNLYRQIQSLFNALEVTPRVYSREAHKYVRKDRNDKEVSHRTSYTIEVCTADLVKLGLNFYKLPKEFFKTANGNDYRSRKAQFIENGYLYRQISSISTEFVENYEVFNLNVADDHTYISDGILVHNCSVPADRDSITGQRSKSPKDYSPYMKFHPGQYIPEHKKYAFVYNDEPTFFDLSIVKRPAERIAHALEYKFASENTKSLLKAASENNTCIPSALLAEIEGIKYSLNTDINDESKSAILNKLASCEEEVANILSDKSNNSDKAKFIKGAALNSYSKDDELDPAIINTLLDKGIKGETFFRGLAKRAAVLPFKSFINFLYPEDTAEKKEAIKIASTIMLPTLFSNLPKMGIDLSALEDLFDSGSALDCLSDCSTSDPVQNIMDEIGDKFSIEEESRGKRMLRIIIINNKSGEDINVEDILPSILKSASEIDHSSEVYNKAVKFSAAYAMYKIAAINDIQKFRGKNLDAAELYALITQDYIYNI